MIPPGKAGSDPRISHRLVGLAVKASVWTVADQSSIPLVPWIFFPGCFIPVTSKLVLQWLPCQVPGVIGSALGVVCPVSVFCEI